MLFLGPLIQLAMDCPWGFIDGMKVVVGKQSFPLLVISPVTLSNYKAILGFK